MNDTIDTTKVLHLTTTWNNEETYHFASIDGGKVWVELDHEPTQEDREAIQTIIDGTRDPETGARTFPITCTRRYFETMSPRFTVSEIREADDK